MGREGERWKHVPRMHGLSDYSPFIVNARTILLIHLGMAPEKMTLRRPIQQPQLLWKNTVIYSYEEHRQPEEGDRENRREVEGATMLGYYLFVLGILKLSKEVLVLEEHVLLVTELDLSAAVVWEKNLVAFLHRHGDDGAIGITCTGSSGDNNTLVQLALSTLWHNHSSNGSFSLHSLHKHSVKKGNQASNSRLCIYGV